MLKDWYSQLASQLAAQRLYILKLENEITQLRSGMCITACTQNAPYDIRDNSKPY